MRAKFACDVVTSTAASETVKLYPVLTGSEENKSFSQYTPSGELTLQITNPEARGFFAPGEEYYLDITKAGKKNTPTDTK